MQRNQRPAQIKPTVVIVGGIIIGFGCLWLVWLLFLQPTAASGASIIMPTPVPAVTPIVQLPPLLSAGIVLGNTNTKPTMSQQQALLIASQLEPAAADQAQSTEARYVLVNYPASSGTPPHPVLNDAATWMIWYKQMPSLAADTSVDPGSASQAHHDLYVFLDAKTGEELFVIWT